MLLAALVDLGADVAAVRDAVDAVVPTTVALDVSTVRRAGLRATKVDVRLLDPAQPHRSWRDVDALLSAAVLAPAVRDRARAVFRALAVAEARAHGTEPDDVHFHEVGAWDSIADVVGTCAALATLDVERVVVGEIALGSGTVRGAHGVLPVPGPAVLELVTGHQVVAGGSGELATPTGVALLVALADDWGPLPALRVVGTGVGAGTRDRPDRANVVRAVLGTATVPARPAPDSAAVVLVETTVDDLDPRVWPSVVDGLLAVGALDAWITPVLMKKGRPGPVLSVLVPQDRAPAVRDLVLRSTSALGVREHPVVRETLDRSWADVVVAGETVAVKIGHRDGRVVHVSPEFEAAAVAAAATGLPVREVLERAAAAAVDAGLVPGNALPGDARPRLR
ncbi:MAG: nickel pincer cofactor biosynthesis protein LarC [Actinobacteria bacterium]|nr:nickel pincer cofactor biosynthesis protein LarC [Actinomycetota bacterium]